MACSASSLFALDIRPITSFLFAGFTEVMTSSVKTFSPLIIKGYVLPDSFATSSNAT